MVVRRWASESIASGRSFDNLSVQRSHRWRVGPHPRRQAFIGLLCRYAASSSPPSSPGTVWTSRPPDRFSPSKSEQNPAVALSAPFSCRAIFGFRKPGWNRLLYGENGRDLSPRSAQARSQRTGCECSISTRAAEQQYVPDEPRLHAESDSSAQRGELPSSLTPGAGLAARSGVMTEVQANAGRCRVRYPVRCFTVATPGPTSVG